LRAVRRSAARRPPRPRLVGSCTCGTPSVSGDPAPPNKSTMMRGRQGTRLQRTGRHWHCERASTPRPRARRAAGRGQGQTCVSYISGCLLQWPFAPSRAPADVGLNVAPPSPKPPSTRRTWGANFAFTNRSPTYIHAPDSSRLRSRHCCASKFVAAWGVQRPGETAKNRRVFVASGSCDARARNNLTESRCARTVQQQRGWFARRTHEAPGVVAAERAVAGARSPRWRARSTPAH
jgi:hypothetical protein